MFWSNRLSSLFNLSRSQHSQAPSVRIVIACCCLHVSDDKEACMACLFPLFCGSFASHLCLGTLLNSAMHSYWHAQLPVVWFIAMTAAMWGLSFCLSILPCCPLSLSAGPHEHWRATSVEACKQLFLEQAALDTVTGGDSVWGFIWAAVLFLM